MEHQLILVVDFGLKHSHIAARRVRGMSVYCEIVSHKQAAQIAQERHPAGAVLAGESGGAYDEQAAIVEKELKAAGIPVYDASKGLDEKALKDFLYGDCGCKGDWTMADYARAMISDIQTTVGDGKVLLGLSGGVDSAVCAALLSKAIGKRLTCIFVDHGLMRKNEGDEVEAAFSGWDITLKRVDAGDRFLGRLRGVTDPETKRKTIGEEFIRVFEEEASKHGDAGFLAQGTIYPDIIESGIGGAVIKSHHNVGGLPEDVNFKEIIEPLRLLFKDEVRELGRYLGLADAFVRRQPFPGPGLAIRVIGEVTAARLDILREADHIFRQEIQNAGLAADVQQYFAVLTSIRSVGVKGDERTYDYAVALRAVTTTDFMQAEFARIPYETLTKASERIVAEVANVNRVLYDITGKPPATIEWE